MIRNRSRKIILHKKVFINGKESVNKHLLWIIKVLEGLPNLLRVFREGLLDLYSELLRVSREGLI